VRMEQIQDHQDESSFAEQIATMSDPEDRCRLSCFSIPLFDERSADRAAERCSQASARDVE
jgi:hypothetical protein